jgi:hypothetical protein
MPAGIESVMADEMPLVISIHDNAVSQVADGGVDVIDGEFEKLELALKVK